MGALSFWHIIIVAAVVILLFGRGKISELMGDVAKGIKSFKKGMADDDVAAAPPATPTATRSIDHDPADAVRVEKTEERSKVG
jgi:sec-independent protein translocase protein TatA